MIIRELGTVVGKLDDKTFELTDSTSDKLTGLIKNWTSNGIEFLSAGDPLDDSSIEADVLRVMPPDNEFFIDALQNQLVIQGFDVQTA